MSPISQFDQSDYIRGATDDTLIGNTNSALHVTLAEDLDVTGAQKVIEVEHAKVHEGHRYSFDEITVIDSGDDYYHGLIAPSNNIFIHIHVTISSLSSSEVRLYEGSTFTGGTEQAYFNRDRNSANTGNLTIVEEPTVTVEGAEMEAHAFGDNGKEAGSSGGGARFEWILKKNTKYLLKITSGANGNKHDLQVNWYEGGPDL